jgi:hypothetical protein
MSRVRVDTLRIGAVLAHDLCDIKGRLLMPAGTELGEEQLRLLRQWHLEVVQIGPDDDEPLHWRDIPLDGLSPALHILHEQHLAELFRFCGRDDECMSALFYFLLDRLDRRSLLEEPPR